MEKQVAAWIYAPSVMRTAFTLMRNTNMSKHEKPYRPLAADPSGKAEYQTHPFPPLYDRESRILILGSFPSVKSREQLFFYGHPRNRFWMTLASVLSEPVPVTIEEKKSFLKDNHIALWDVIHSCRIRGSSDSSIRDVVPNDLSEILSCAPIQQIYCNGMSSWNYYRRYQEKKTGIPAIKLPSTSPANAAWSPDRLVQEWKAICGPLQAAPPGLGQSLLNWYDYHARTLPWRSDPNPYHVWISEIMLQQTRVETVISYYRNFLKHFPSIKELAEGDEEELMKVWEGLGYYRRARFMKEAAVQITDRFEGEMPEDYESLRSLPGIGDYTAGAIASIAFGQRRAAVDGNVLRVYARLLGQKEDISKAAIKRDIGREVLRTMPAERPGDFNQALMDLGAGVCLANGMPRCHECPWDTACTAHKAGKEREFPIKKEKKARKIEYKTVLCIEYKDCWILHRRDSEGLLAGMWELPCLEGYYSFEAVEKLLLQWDIEDYNLTGLGEGSHVFSHVEWRMQGYRLVIAELPSCLLKDREWVLASREDLTRKYAVPAAFNRFHPGKIHDK